MKPPTSEQTWPDSTRKIKLRRSKVSTEILTTQQHIKRKKNIENAKAPLGIEPTTFNQMIASKFTLRRFDSFKQSLYTRKNYQLTQKIISHAIKLEEGLLSKSRVLIKKKMGKKKERFYLGSNHRPLNNQ